MLTEVRFGPRRRFSKVPKVAATGTFNMADTQHNASALGQGLPGTNESTRAYPAIHLIHIMMLCLIPFIWKWTGLQRRQSEDEKEEQRQIKEHFEEAWETKDWYALYGLIAMANDRRTEHTPFREVYRKTVQERWHEPNRLALERLLEFGIIPLNVDDGGLATYQFRPWKWLKAFPYVQLPRYRQEKTRAFFEFLLPHPNNPRRLGFLDLVMSNDHDLGASMSINERATGPPTIETSTSNPPILKEYHPFSVGAESMIEARLPFMRDRRIPKAHSVKVNQINWFFDGLDSNRIPLLGLTKSVVVRVESRHWGRMELEPMVLGLAERSRMQRQYATEMTWGAAERLLKCHGLSVDDM